MREAELGSWEQEVWDAPAGLLGKEREKQREESCGEVLEKEGRPMAAINQHSLQRECPEHGIRSVCSQDFSTSGLPGLRPSRSSAALPRDSQPGAGNAGPGAQL